VKMIYRTCSPVIMNNPSQKNEKKITKNNIHFSLYVSKSNARKLASYAALSVSALDHMKVMKQYA